MQTRDEIRTQVQDQIRQVVRDARDAAREAAAEATGGAMGGATGGLQGGPDFPAPTTPIDGNFLLDVLRGEISVAREDVANLTARLGSGAPRQQEAIEAQLNQASTRLNQLQARLDELLSGQPAITFTEQGDPFPPGLDGERIERMARNATEGFFFTVVALAIGIPLVRAFARWLDRRGAPAAAPENTGRLDRIEQALDSVAVEVERIAEGQRYTSKMLGELRALPAADPLPPWTARPRDTERVRHTTPV
ncbi:MAG: hypothetical protein IPK85_12515 [Gemmatimonadetes bacterium]|nr:hypothetical protein [Gemmatimonadota bacterium]